MRRVRSALQLKAAESLIKALTVPPFLYLKTR